MDLKDSILPLLPEGYAGRLEKCDWSTLEELRIGSGRPVRLRMSGQEQELWPMVTQEQIEEILQRACRFSAYAYQDTIAQGYLTIPGGHRIGICGFGVLEKDGTRLLRSPSSLNIRVAREVKGCAVPMLQILNQSTLILGPPGSGKTTLLRDAVRLLSDRRRQNIGLVDERGEVSASTDGVPQLCVGSRTDILLNIPKSSAIMMLLRTMNPQWIALDEITAPQDISAMEQAAYCGVKLLATAHADEVEDLKKRPLYRHLLQTRVFERAVLLGRDKSYSVQEVDL